MVSEALDFKGSLTSDPETMDETKSLPLIYILVGVVALTELAKMLLDVYRDAQYSGILIRKDKQTGKLKIENDPGYLAEPSLSYRMMTKLRFNSKLRKICKSRI